MFLLQQVPHQLNGYDCGVYTIKFFEMLVRRLPSSTRREIDRRFGGKDGYFRPDAYSPEDIVDEREELRLEITKYVTLTSHSNNLQNSMIHISSSSHFLVLHNLLGFLDYQRYGRKCAKSAQ